MEDIKVSVCCLAYNHEKYIKKTLDGFIMQKTTFKFEVIINDDASTDHTKEIIQEYVERYPQIFVPIYQTENQYKKTKLGITGSILLPRARGKYVAFCEGDDYWCNPSKLQKQYEAMEAHKECSICLHKVQCINENGDLNGKVYPPSFYQFETGKLSKTQAAESLWMGTYNWQTSSYFIRKDVLKIWLEDEPEFTKNINGDVRFLRISFLTGDFYYISEVMSHYRECAEGSYSSQIRTWSKKQIAEDKSRMIEAKFAFDEYTKQKYHQYVFSSIVLDIFRMGNIDGLLAKKMFDKYEIKLIDIYHNMGIKSVLKYIIIKIIPFLFTWIYKLKEKIKNRK